MSLDEEVEEVQVLDFENYDTKDWVMDGVQFDFSDGYANGKQNRTEIDFFTKIICRILCTNLPPVLHLVITHRCNS